MIYKKVLIFFSNTEIIIQLNTKLTKFATSKVYMNVTVQISSTDFEKTMMCSHSKCDGQQDIFQTIQYYKLNLIFGANNMEQF